MTTIDNRIHLLDGISQNKIKYSVQIRSLNDTVLELVKNALDAHAENIKITLNYAHGFCSILDNGSGIPTSEFEPDGGLGKSFHTSKLGRTHEKYGRNGRYLAALSGVSLLSIASRVNGGDTHVLWLDQSGRLRHAREPPDTLEFETGTRVKVYGLFSKLPVRSRSLIDRFASPSEVLREFEKLKIGITGLILAAPDNFSIVTEHSSPKHVYRYKPSKEQTSSLSFSDRKSITSVSSAIRQAGHVEASQLCHWQETAIRSGSLSIYGLISKLPMPHKMVQYLSLNHLPLTRQAQPDLFHSINTFFEQSAFGNSFPEDTTELADSQHKRRLRSHAKEVDKWPMFIIWINTTSDSIHELVHDAIVSPRAQRLLEQIKSLMRNLVEEFLIAHEYTKPRKERTTRNLEVTKPLRSTQIALANEGRDESKESFRHCSRVRSSRVSVMDDILAGLPFHEAPRIDKREASVAVEDPQSLGKTSNTAAVACDIVVSTPSVSTEKEIDDRSYIPWKDPQTGRILRLDARTSMELPSHPVFYDVQTTNDANQDSAKLDNAASFSMSKSPREEAEPSLAEVARNVRNYAQGLAPKQDESIRVLGFFAHVDEDFEQYRSSATNLKAESFWAGTDHCCSHYSVQRETPSISIKALRSAKVLRQVNRQFILAMMQGQDVNDGTHRTRSERMVLIDQHAADERCRVEALLKSVYQDDGILLTTQIVFDVSRRESDLLQSARAYFAQWHILYELCEILKVDSECRVRQLRVTSLPSAIAERCRLHPEFIINILREEIYSDRKHLQYTKPSQPNRHSSIYSIPIPPRLVEMINSRACRSAIMFNDELGIERCEALVKELGNCTLPFQCAHGRPSMVVLADIADLEDHNPLAPRLKTTSTYFNTKYLSRIDSNQPSSGHTTDYRKTTLNTIDDNTMTFRQAYQTWAGSGNQISSDPDL